MSRDTREISKAIKKRILDEINSRAQAQNVINNYVGGEPSRPKTESATLAERMSKSDGEDDPFDYKVMIGRKNRPDGDGWDKLVHRYRKKKDEDDPYIDMFEHLKKKGGKGQ